MLSFSRKYIYNDNSKAISQILNGDALYGYIIYNFHNNNDNDNDNDSYDDDNDDDDDYDDYHDPDIICEFCAKIFNRKYDKLRHQHNGCCKAKLINDFVKYNTLKQKKIKDIFIDKSGARLKGGLKFGPLADGKNRENILIMGPQNSGKSYYASMYIKSFEKIKPEHDLFLVSRIEDDDAFKNFDNMAHVRISDELLDDPIDIKNELKKSLVVFDDIEDSTLNKKTQDYVYKLNSEVMVNGRDQSKTDNDIYSLTTLHITDYHKTRKILNEATCYVLFLPFGYQSERVIKIYANVKKPIINKIEKMDTRWVAIYNKYKPTFIMGEKEIILL